MRPTIPFRKRLLLIEDVGDNREMLQFMLSDDFEVTAFNGCSDALDDAERVAPDLLLMDIGMPEIDGIECLRRLRGISTLAKTPAIAVTAFAYPEDKARFLAAGFQAVVVKPVRDPAELHRLINTVIG